MKNAFGNSWEDGVGAHMNGSMNGNARGRQRYRREVSRAENNGGRLVAAVKRAFPGTVELRQRPMPRQCRHPERRVTPDYPNVEMCDRCCGGLTLAQWYWDERNG